MGAFLVVLINLLLTAASTASAAELTVKKAIKETVITGYTRNATSQDISSEISGKVLKVNYDIGAKVGKEPFIILDPTFVDYEIKTNIQSLERIDVLIQKALTGIAYLEKESSRVDALISEEMVTESRRDTVKHDLEQAKLELESIMKDKALLSTRLEELKERRARHYIYAPHGWTITGRKVEQNEVVQSGVPFARVSDFRELVVPLSVSSAELNAIQELPSVFEASLEDVPVKASLNWINPEFNETTRKLDIEIIIKDHDRMNRGGLKFRLPVTVGTEGIFVPKKAVSSRYENPAIRLKKTGELVQLLVLGENEEYILAAEDHRLAPGTALLPADAVHKSGEK